MLGTRAWLQKCYSIGGWCSLWAILSAESLLRFSGAVWSRNWMGFNV